MRRDKSFASAVAISMAVLVLTACGPDDSASSGAPSSSSKGMTAADGGAVQRAAALPATPILNTSSTLAANAAATANAAAAASDPITQDMQASLAADSRQVAPVMHYAPGDSATSN
ncbi:hypothetical protein B0G83_10168 [Paraburkholderia sp. BL21I4N1]|nr:hypothetical protein B0G83_10168 [Paraburkholderia sp. BL21I4N1]